MYIMSPISGAASGATAGVFDPSDQLKPLVLTDVDTLRLYLEGAGSL